MKTKQKLSLLLASAVLSTSIWTSNLSFAAAAAAPKVFLNGTEVQFDVQPQYINGRTYVPFRKLLEALGAKVDWDEQKQLATATKDGLSLTFTTGSTTLTFENHNLSMDVPVVMIDYRNLVPLRFVAQALGAKVDWSRTSTGDEIQITQSYDEMIDRLVNGKNAAGDMKVTYDQAAIFFEWLYKGQDMGKLPEFTGSMPLKFPSDSEFEDLYPAPNDENMDYWVRLSPQNSGNYGKVTRNVFTKIYRFEEMGIFDGKTNKKISSLILIGDQTKQQWDPSKGQFLMGYHPNN